MRIDKTQALGCSSDPYLPSIQSNSPKQITYFLLFHTAVLRELAGAPGGCAPGTCANDPNSQGLIWSNCNRQQIYPVVRRVCDHDDLSAGQNFKKKKNSTGWSVTCDL